MMEMKNNMFYGAFVTKQNETRKPPLETTERVLGRVEECRKK